MRATPYWTKWVKEDSPTKTMTITNKNSKALTGHHKHWHAYWMDQIVD